MAVVHELARGKDGRHQLGAVADRIQATLQQTHQHLAGVAAHAFGFGIDLAKLLFGQVAIVTLQLLLGAQLRAEVRQLVLPALAVLAGAILALVHRRFRPAPDVFAHPAVDLVLGRGALGHR